jgi:methionyl-tRNA formyltransferase
MGQKRKESLMKVLLVAEESAGLQTLRMLLDTQHSVAAVLTADATSGRGATVGDLARQSDVPVLRSDLVKNGIFCDWIIQRDIDLLLNIHSLYVIHPDIVAAPGIGSFNLHPGPLPRYAGLNAPSWAIYYGETTHAVTLHWMDARIDTGAIAYTSEFEITDNDTGLSVSAKCARHGLTLVRRLVDAAEGGKEAIPARGQDGGARRYFGREAPQEGRIEWAQPARNVVNFVRAADYAPFPSPWGHPVAKLDGRAIGIAKATLTGRAASGPPGTVSPHAGGDGVLVATADEWVAVTRLEVGGKYSAAEELVPPGSKLTDG